jgi:hypothetical protein
MSVTNYQSTLRKISEQRRSHALKTSIQYLLQKHFLSIIGKYHNNKDNLQLICYRASVCYSVTEQINRNVFYYSHKLSTIEKSSHIT